MVIKKVRKNKSHFLFFKSNYIMNILFTYKFNHSNMDTQEAIRAGMIATEGVEDVFFNIEAKRVIFYTKIKSNQNEK